MSKTIKKNKEIESVEDKKRYIMSFVIDPEHHQKMLSVTKNSGVKMTFIIKAALKEWLDANYDKYMDL